MLSKVYEGSNLINSADLGLLLDILAVSRE